jgi:metaxin
MWLTGTKPQLHALYLSPQNTPLLEQLYINPTSSSYLVRRATHHQLRDAAETEILKSTACPAVDRDETYGEARKALAALSTLLGDELWFGGGGGGRQSSTSSSNTAERPSLFDASVFAYTHLLLDESLGWRDRTFPALVGEFPNLVAHERRLYELCFREA